MTADTRSMWEEFTSWSSFPAGVPKPCPTLTMTTSTRSMSTLKLSRSTSATKTFQEPIILLMPWLAGMEYWTIKKPATMATTGTAMAAIAYAE